MATPPPDDDDDDGFPFPADPAPPAPLTDEQIARLLATPAQVPPSYDQRFEALNRRRGRALSEEQIVAILAAAPPAADRPPDLPTAAVSPVPYRPAVMLDYRTGRPHRRTKRHHEWADVIDQSPAALPLALRVARVAVWLLLAGLILLLFLDPPGRG